MKSLAMYAVFDLVISEKWSIFVAMALLSLTRGFLPPIVSSLLRNKYLRNNTSELFCHDGKLSTQMLNSCCCKLCFFLSDLQIIGSKSTKVS